MIGLQISDVCVIPHMHILSPVHEKMASKLQAHDTDVHFHGCLLSTENYMNPVMSLFYRLNLPIDAISTLHMSTHTLPSHFPSTHNHGSNVH